MYPHVQQLHSNKTLKINLSFKKGKKKLFNRNNFLSIWGRKSSTFCVKNASFSKALKAKLLKK
jgi:hypothetical protein